MDTVREAVRAFLVVLFGNHPREMTMGLFLVTFDLSNASESSYENIYKWAHELGGFRFFQFQDGTWGRLSSTTVIIPLQATNNIAARDEFRSALERGGFNPTHITVADGRGWAAYSTVIPEWEVPNYAKGRATAGV